MARYEAGETLASIAKTYDCSPPAISYIVSRSRARRVNGAAGHHPAPAAEPQLIKTHSHPQRIPEADSALPPQSPAVSQSGPHSAPAHTVGGHAERPADHDPFDDRGERHLGGFPGLPPAVSRPVAVSPATGPAQPAEHRPTLHLSLGNGGATAPNEAGSLDRHEFAERAADFAAHREPAPPQATQQHSGHSPGPSDSARPADLLPNGSSNGAPAGKNGAGGYLDQQLRSRIDSDIAAFLSAFDAALSEDTQENRSALREATDRLLRAGARTRIELERLEARVPLPPRQSPPRFEAAWRGR